MSTAASAESPFPGSAPGTPSHRGRPVQPACRPGNDVDVQQQQCPKDSYAILPEKCRCVDQQTLKLQESHDMIPVGELPRQVLLTVDRYASIVNAWRLTRQVPCEPHHARDAPDRQRGLLHL